MTEWVLVPREPVDAQLTSMALTYDHGYGLRNAFERENIRLHMAQLHRAMLEAAPAAPQMTDAEMIRTEAWQSITDELAHAAYLRGIEEGKRQATTPQDRSAPARPEDMAAFAAGLKADHAKTQAFFKAAGILTERGELMPEYGGPQQAEPVEIVPRVWREALRKLTFMARTSGGTPGPDEGLQTACAEAETLLSKPYNYPPAAPQQAEPVGYFVNDESDDQWHQVDYEQRNGADTYPLYLHPPAAEVQRLRDAALAVLQEYNAHGGLRPSAMNPLINELRRALEGGE